MRESKNMCASYLTKLLIDLNGIWYIIETFWCDEPHFHCIMPSQYSRERTLLIWLHEKKNKQLNNGLYSDVYRLVSFKLSLMIKTAMLYILISVWVTLILFKVTVLYGNKKNFGIHFLANVSIDLN